MIPRNMTWNELEEWIRENSKFPDPVGDNGVAVSRWYWERDVDDWIKRMVQAFRQIKVYRLDDPIYEWYMKWLSQFTTNSEEVGQ